MVVSRIVLSAFSTAIKCAQRLTASMVVSQIDLAKLAFSSACAQRLTASMVVSPLPIWSLTTDIPVLNALRHQW